MYKITQKSTFLFLAIVAATLFCGTVVIADTTVSSNITSNTTWIKSSSPYIVTSNISVNAGVTLTIEPGVVIKFGDNIGLWVDGTLNAIGNESNRITFTGTTESPDWWRAIFVQNSGSATFDWCTISYGGWWDAANIRQSGDSSLLIKNSTVSQSSSYGVYISGSTGTTTLENSTFSKNGASGLYINSSPLVEASECTFKENGDYGILHEINDSVDYAQNSFIDNADGSVGINGGSITKDTIWAPDPNNSDSYSIVVRGGITIAEGTTLTVLPNTVVKFGDNVGLWVDGTLNAVGRADAPIYFTDLRDDSVGGDSNNDGDASAPAPDWWRAIFVQNNGSATFEWCTISYAGWWERANIAKSGTGSLSLKNSTISYSVEDGLRIAEGSSSLILANNTFSNNYRGVRLGINSSFDDNTSNFHDNNINVYVDGGIISQNTVWNLKKDYSFCVRGDITIAEGATLEIKPGTVVKPGDNVGIWVDGTLNAVGTSIAPIYFTDFRDDTVGGDNYQDGNNTLPAPDWWRAIFVQNNGSAIFDWCTISYGGWWDAANIRQSGNSSLLIKNSTVSQSSSYGVYISGSTGTTTLENSTFSKNGASGLYINSSPLVEASECTFKENGDYGILQEINDSVDYAQNSFIDNADGSVGINGGSITKDTIWAPDPNNSDSYSIVVRGNITVAEGTTLTVLPNTVVKFGDNIGLWVDGTLNAAGRADAPIYFTDLRDDSVGGDSNNDGDASAPGSDWWRAIFVQNNGSATFDWCTISYAGWWERANIAKSGTGSLSLKNSTISYSVEDGLRIAEGSSSLILANNNFSNNYRGVRLGINSSFDDNTSDFNNNNINMLVDGGTITKDVVWNLKKNYSFYLNANITIAEGANLEIKPGTVVKPGDNVGIWVDGTLNAVGTSTAPIYFTDWRDDTVGGDANKDGNSSLPEKDWWRAIFVQNNGSAAFVCCNIAYGGWWDGTNILKTGSGSLVLNSSMVSYSNGDGLRIDNSTGDDEIKNTIFTANNTGILVRNKSSEVVISGSFFEDNASYGILNQAAAQVDARSCWWGDLSGPYHSTANAQGAGDRVSDNVLFDPWKLNDSSTNIISPLYSGTLVQGDYLRFLGSTSNDPSTSYIWNFGDGRTSNNLNPGLVGFPSAGTYPITFSTVQQSGSSEPNPDSRNYTVIADTGAFPDLTVTGMNIPYSIAIGTAGQITYSVRNAGNSALNNSSWTDAVYLSTDEYLDTQDMLLSSTPAPVNNLAPNDSYQGIINVTLPVVEEGAYYLILSVDDSWSIVEKHQLNNEYASSMSVMIPALANNVSQTVNYGAGRVEQYYRMTAADCDNLVLNFVNSQAGNSSSALEVYTSFGSVPTRGGYDFRLTGNKIIIPAATAGDWYVMIYGNAAQSGEYTIEYEMTDIILSSIAPSQHTTLTDLELAINGAGLISPLYVTLISSTGASFAADSVEVDSFDSATALFTAGKLPPGTYSVKVSNNNKSDELPSVLEIIEGGTPKFETRLVLPSAFGYHQLATVYVEYENTGNASMPAPLLVVTASQNGKAGAMMTLDQTRLSSGFWTSVMPEGFANSVQFIASGKIPGVLQPGESGRVPVYYAGWQQPWDISYPPFNWNVLVLDANNTSPVAWADLKDDMYPSYIRQDAWDIVWNNFTSQAGTTWGDYVAMLSRNALYLHRQGEKVDDITNLLSLSFRQADGLNPMSILAGSTDAAVQSSGLELIFQRQFVQPISRRFEIGALGRGWAHNWHYALTKRADGTVEIVDMSGTPRIFQPDSRYPNSYIAQPGDYGKLQTVSGRYILKESDGTVKSFSSDGKLEYIEDTNANRISCVYAANHLIELTHSSGQTLELAYTGDYISSVTDSSGRKTTYSYNGEYLSSVNSYDGQNTTYSYNTTIGSASQHALTQIIFPDGTHRIFTYDTQGRLSTVARDNNAEKITFSYEDSGRVNATDVLGNTSRFFFDYTGRMVKGENALGEAVRLSFDELGNLSTITDPDGISSTFQYNNRGNIVEISDALRQTTKFTYTRNLNRLASVTDAKGNRSNYDYDNSGNLNSITYPDGSSESWVYDAKGNPTAWTNRRGKAVNFTYDSDGNVTGKTYSDGSQASYAYDNRNNLTQAVDKSGTTTFIYDANDYLVRIDYPNNRWLAFTYDTVGRRSSSSDQLGYTINYYYDNGGRLSRISDGTTDIVSYDYDLVGRLDRKTMGNGVYTTYSYDAAGRLLSLVNYTPNNQELSRFVYTYDRRSRRTSMTTNYGKWTYSYDDIGQLVHAVLVSADAAIPNQDIVYQYDQLGNRTKVITNGNSESYDSNNLNQYTKVGDRTYTYDADGNLIEESGADGTTTYTYNDDNRLVGIAKVADNWEYTYDALGNRVAVDENGSTTHYVVDPVGLGDVVGEYDTSGNLVARYNHGIGLLSRITSGTFGSTDYYTFDPMGNTTELTGTAGVIKNSYAYEPFGMTILKNQTVPNPFQFVGEMGTILDTNGLNHVRARQYLSSIGRFIQSDPIGILDGLNSYTYAINNTLSFTDISGLYTGNLGALPKIIGFDNASGAGAEMIKNIFTQAQLNGARAKTVKEVFVKGVWKYGKYFSSIEKAERFARIQRFSAVVKAKRIASAARAIPQAIGYSKMAIASNVAAAYLAFEAGYFIGEALDTHVPNNWLSTSAYKLSSKLCDWYYAVSGAEFTSGTAGSQDPNQKLAVSGYGTSNFVPQDKLLTYRIDFENDNQATAPAQVVQIS
ncbi:MAG: right-handed parallel beta-helix repeat-containing protein, partial [Desulfamplus sp.]